MRIFEVFVLFANGVTARGLVPGSSYANVRDNVRTELGNRQDIVSIEVNRVD